MTTSNQCPTCDASLSSERRIAGEWVEVGWPALQPVRPRVCCGHCLTVARLGKEEVAIEIPGSIVIRRIERLDAAYARGELAREFKALAEDPRFRLLLRVPEVFRSARPAFEELARLTTNSSFTWNAQDGRLELSERNRTQKLSKRAGRWLVRALPEPGEALHDRAHGYLSRGWGFRIVSPQPRGPELLLAAEVAIRGSRDFLPLDWEGRESPEAFLAPLDLLEPSDDAR